MLVVLQVSKTECDQPYLGGLGLCDAKVSLVLLILIIVFVSYVTVTRKDTPVEYSR